MRAKFTVPGTGIPQGFYRILTSGDPLPKFYVELEGPADAFQIKEGKDIDAVKVLKPELVRVERFQRA